MAARIVEAPYLTIAAANCEHGVCAQPRCDVIAMFWQLAFVTDVKPTRIKYFPHL
tara:strand:+ start:121 stop:285 length:165 start_codon:yes stop_codon:yes gene_type:complete